MLKTKILKILLNDIKYVFHYLCMNYQKNRRCVFFIIREHGESAHHTYCCCTKLVFLKRKHFCVIHSGFPLIEFPSLYLYFQIVACDQQGMGLESTENLVIHVGDVNDNRPEFPQNYSFSVPRESAIGSPVGIVKAVDKDVTSRNSRILYSIKSSSRGDFVVNIQTGP